MVPVLTRQHILLLLCQHFIHINQTDSLFWQTAYNTPFVATNHMQDQALQLITLGHSRMLIQPVHNNIATLCSISTSSLQSLKKDIHCTAEQQFPDNIRKNYVWRIYICYCKQLSLIITSQLNFSQPCLVGTPYSVFAIPFGCALKS